MIITKIDGVIKKMKEIFLTEKEIVFLVLLYFHGNIQRTPCPSIRLLKNLYIFDKKQLIFKKYTANLTPSN